MFIFLLIISKFDKFKKSRNYIFIKKQMESFSFQKQIQNLHIKRNFTGLSTWLYFDNFIFSSGI